MKQHVHTLYIVLLYVIYVILNYLINFLIYTIETITYNLTRLAITVKF